jgi:AcrR family transcriptional regulator
MRQFEREFKPMLTEPPKNPTRADQRRNEIIIAAVRAIRQRGLEGVRMRDVARDAGLSTGNLYYYFRNKRELIYFCQDHALDLLIERVGYAYGVSEVWRRVDAIIEGHLRVVIGLGAVLHVDIDGLPKPLHKKLLAKRDRYEKAVLEMIVLGQRAKQFRDGDPMIRAQAIFGALNWVTRWYRPTENEAEEVETIVKMFRVQLMRGLLCTRD